MLLDHRHDTGLTELHRLSSLYPLPELVKQASGELLEESPAEPAKYADWRGMNYPCHSAEATLLSWVYFLENGEKLAADRTEETAARLIEFGNYWGVGQEQDDLRSAWEAAEQAKIAAQDYPDEYYAVVGTDHAGQPAKRYRLAHPEEIKVAADWLIEHRDSLLYPHRRAIAERILNRAEATQTILPFETAVQIEKHAGCGVASAAQAAAALLSRAVRLPEGELRTDLRKTAAALQQSPMFDTDTITASNLCGLLDTVDRSHNLTRLYDHELLRPEDSIYYATQKEAAAAESQVCILPSGEIYATSQFKSLKAQDLAAVFTWPQIKQACDGLYVGDEKLASLVSQLSVPASETFRDLLASRGEQPIDRVSKTGAITPEQRESLARTYVSSLQLPPASA